VKSNDACHITGVLRLFAVSCAVAVVAFFNVISRKMLGFTFGADVFGTVALILVTFVFFVLWIHAHDFISFM
jgi:hypothetical protein